MRLSWSNRTGLSKCGHSEGQGPTELVWSSSLVEVEVEKKYINLNISCLSKVVLVVVVVLHGQNCIVNENCLYKAILKTKNVPPKLL